MVEKPKRITSVEAKRIVDVKQIELDKAKEAYNITVIQELNFEKAQTTIRLLEDNAMQLQTKIANLEKIPAIKTYIEIIKEWEHKLHEHLNGEDQLNDADLDDLYQALQSI